MASILNLAGYEEEICLQVGVGDRELSVNDTQGVFLFGIRNLVILYEIKCAFSTIYYKK